MLKRFRVSKSLLGVDTGGFSPVRSARVPRWSARLDICLAGQCWLTHVPRPLDAVWSPPRKRWSLPRRSRRTAPALILPGACATLPSPVPSRLSTRRSRQPPAPRPEPCCTAAPPDRRRPRRTAPAWSARGTPGPTRGAHYRSGTRLQLAPSTVQKSLGPCNSASAASPSLPVPPQHTGPETPRRLYNTPAPGPVRPVAPVNPPPTPAPSVSAPPVPPHRARLACTRDSRPDPRRALWTRYPTQASTQHGPEGARSLQLTKPAGPAAPHRPRHSPAPVQHSRPRPRYACHGQSAAHAKPPAPRPEPSCTTAPPVPHPPGLHEGLPARPVARTMDPVSDSCRHPARSGSSSVPSTQPLPPHSTRRHPVAQALAHHPGRPACWS